MKKLILFLFILVSLFSNAQIQMSQVNGLIPKLNSKQDSIQKGTGFLKRSGSTWSYDSNTYQPSLYGVGFVKINGSTISYDPLTYLTVESLSPYSTTVQSNALYESKFAQGYPNQYLRGDKTWQLFPTALSSFTNDLGNYGGWITGINSGMVTTALGYTPEQPLTFSTGLTRSGNTITNNITQYTDALARSAQTNSSITTALGYTPYNASNPSGYITSSALSGYLTTSTGILNQNSSAQSANMWISGICNIGGFKISGNLQATNGYGLDIFYGQSAKTAYMQSYGRGTDDLYHPIEFGASNYDFKIGAATFSSTVNSTGFLLNGNNLTSSLSTNYTPKWNGSSFVNSIISDEGTIASVGGGLHVNRSSIPFIRLRNASGDRWGMFADLDESGSFSLYSYISNSTRFKIQGNGDTNIPSTTQSTSPTTGALVVGGGIGIGGVSHFGDDIVASSTIQASEFVKSGGTSSQFLKANGSVDATSYQPSITLTTNGTSGAATFSGNTLNVPNYTTSGNFILNQLSSPQTANMWISGSVNSSNLNIRNGRINISSPVKYLVNGSSSGTAEFSDIFEGGAYKKIIVYLNHLVGTATWEPDGYGFTHELVVLSTSGLPVTKVTSIGPASITVTGTGDTGFLILEGY